MLTITLVTHELDDWPEEFQLEEEYVTFSSATEALIHIRIPFDEKAWPLERVMHGLEHAIDRSFTNETHHPVWHFCIRSVPPFGLRFEYHNVRSTAKMAAQLIANGQIVIT